MTGRTHDVFAFASLVTIATFYPPNDLNLPTVLASLVGNIVGSLLPDMDQATNRLWDLLPGGDFLGRILRRIFLGHRTLSHSLVGFFLFYRGLEWAISKIFNQTYIDTHVVFLSIMIGIASHLLADFITKEGLPLFFPLKLKIGFPPFAFMRVRTGSFAENFIVLPAIGIYLIVFINYNQEGVLKLLHPLFN